MVLEALFGLDQEGVIDLAQYLLFENYALLLFCLKDYLLVDGFKGVNLLVLLAPH